VGETGQRGNDLRLDLDQTGIPKRGDALSMLEGAVRRSHQLRQAIVLLRERKRFSFVQLMQLLTELFLSGSGLGVNLREITELLRGIEGRPKQTKQQIKHESKAAV
jgi:hypothetical protein